MLSDDFVYDTFMKSGKLEELEYFSAVEYLTVLNFVLFHKKVFSFSCSIVKNSRTPSLLWISLY